MFSSSHKLSLSRSDEELLTLVCTVRKQSAIVHSFSCLEKVQTSPFSPPQLLCCQQEGLRVNEMRQPHTHANEAKRGGGESSV